MNHTQVQQSTVEAINDSKKAYQSSLDMSKVNVSNLTGDDRPDKSKQSPVPAIEKKWIFPLHKS